VTTTTDRLSEFEAQCNPPPWPVTFFYDMPDEEFTFLFALSQAWPLLRDELLMAEATINHMEQVATERDSERARILDHVVELEKTLETERRQAAVRIATLEHQLGVSRGEVEQLTTIIAAKKIELRTALAERVCNSLQSRGLQGPHMTHGHYDAKALADWKAGT
jgi:hypothetical protein